MAHFGTDDTEVLSGTHARYGSAFKIVEDDQKLLANLFHAGMNEVTDGQIAVFEKDKLSPIDGVPLRAFFPVTFCRWRDLSANSEDLCNRAADGRDIDVAGPIDRKTLRFVKSGGKRVDGSVTGGNDLLGHTSVSVPTYKLLDPSTAIPVGSLMPLPSVLMVL